MLSLIKGDSLRARALRGSIWTAFGFGTSQVLRLGSNLILTRILFPEAFGLMALVQVFLVGLTMFSDLGIRASIIQNSRSDEPDFLNTAWTIQVIRGFVLWFCACALAWPAAQLYDAPMLTMLLPVAGLTAVLQGFTPTKVHVANRDLKLGHITLIDLATQICTIAIMIAIALATGSVWSLVIGTIIGEALKLALYTAILTGPENQFRWERSSVKQLISFGKWILLSTICGFILNQGDRAALGAYLNLKDLGVYSIGYAIAAIPLTLTRLISDKIMFPLYKKAAPADSRQNFIKIRKYRLFINLSLLIISAPISIYGVDISKTLFDYRYESAGAIIVLISCANAPVLMIMNYSSAILASGQSNKFFRWTILLAVSQILILLIGLNIFGLISAICALSASLIITYPTIVKYIYSEKSWDPMHDIIVFLCSICIVMVSIYRNLNDILSIILPLH